MFAAHADPLYGKDVAGKPKRFALPRAAVIEVEGQVNERYIDTKEPDHRPRADREETDPDGETDEAEKCHQQPKITRSQTAVRQQHSLEKRPGGSLSIIGTCGHASET
jgi:hypothetical protein